MYYRWPDRGGDAFDGQLTASNGSFVVGTEYSLDGLPVREHPWIISATVYVDGLPVEKRKQCAGTVAVWPTPTPCAGGYLHTHTPNFSSTSCLTQARVDELLLVWPEDTEVTQVEPLSGHDHPVGAFYCQAEIESGRMSVREFKECIELAKLEALIPKP